MQKVLITGANGFIGVHLVKVSKSMGLYPYAGVRRGADISSLSSTGVDILYLDYEDVELLSRVLKSYQFDIIIHNAGMTRSPSLKTLFKVNKEYLVNFVEAIRLSQSIPSKLLYVSSLAAYGPADNVVDGIIKLDSMPEPVTNYGRSKLAAEQYLRTVEDIPWLVIRPTAVYGPGEKDLLTVFQMISKGLNLMVGYLPQKLTFIYGEDLAYLMLEMSKSKFIHKFYFASDGMVYSGSEFGKLIKNALGRRVVKIKISISIVRSIAYISETFGRITKKYPILNKDKVNEIQARNWSVDVSATMQDFNFSPRSLHEGVPQTVKWYKEQKWI
jgi:nucleoside-diphosphate-sugar epimerase